MTCEQLSGGCDLKRVLDALDDKSNLRAIRSSCVCVCVMLLVQVYIHNMCTGVCAAGVCVAWLASLVLSYSYTDELGHFVIMFSV